MTMRTACRRPANNERGAVLIQVAIAMIALLALCAFVIDTGVMWVSKGQAQNAADAGALAGAISLAFDNPTDQPGARTKAIGVARQNLVWAQQPDIVNTDVTFPACPPGGLPDTCVRVNTFRNQRPGGSPLPVFFAGMVGIANQGVRATATAQVVTGDTTDCLKPWAIIDRWDEYDGAGEPDYPNPDPDFLPSSTFDRYSTGRGGAPPQENDFYVRPAPPNTLGTGFRLPEDSGRRFAIKVDTNTNATVSAGWFRAIRLPRLDGQTGATSTATTSPPAAGFRRALPTRPPSVRTTSGTTTGRIGRSVDASGRSRATWSARPAWGSSSSSPVTAEHRGLGPGSWAVRSVLPPRVRAWCQSVSSTSTIFFPRIRTERMVCFASSTFTASSSRGWET